MSTLMRAPQPCASWEWELDGFAPPGLDSALMTAARMTVVLREHGLLEPGKLEWKWLLPGRGSIGAGTSLALKGSLESMPSARAAAEGLLHHQLRLKGMDP
ncbi:MULTISPECIES: hypothetical protein [unclassified Streptomyces]|uniref:hypothetical protein n=1 Tax=unclassified Streptomyces TaxID=2593676 RepID=UPI003D8D32F7